VLPRTLKIVQNKCVRDFWITLLITRLFFRSYLSLRMQYPVCGPCALNSTESFLQVEFRERHLKKIGEAGEEEAEEEEEKGHQI
jgi:hypothetical protein